MLPYFLHKITWKRPQCWRILQFFVYKLPLYYEVIFLDLQKGLNWLWIEKKKTSIYLVPNCKSTILKFSRFYTQSNLWAFSVFFGSVSVVFPHAWWSSSERNQLGPSWAWIEILDVFLLFIGFFYERDLWLAD